MAWTFNGIENESDCVSAAGTLRDGESDLALAARDDDLDRHGLRHVFLAAVFFFAADQLMGWLIGLVLSAGA